MVLNLIISGNAHAGLFDNKYFPSKKAKNHCNEYVYTSLFGSIANADKTDEHKRIMYKKCIEEYYED